MLLISGPDTDSKKELIPSTDPAAPPAPTPSEWTMRLYSSSEPLSKMPDVSTLSFLGHRTVRSIDFRDADDFKQVIKIRYVRRCVIKLKSRFLINAPELLSLRCDSIFQFIPSMPNDNVAGEFFGKLDIVKKGSYTLCTISDDGYVVRLICNCDIA